MSTIVSLRYLPDETLPLIKRKRMTEKEKMLKGQNYNSRDPELIEMYHTARQLLQEYNRLDSREVGRREAILTALFGGMGANVWIEAPFYCDYGENIFIGENTFINTNCIFLDDNEVRIGENGLIGPYVQIYTASHPLKASERIKTPGRDGNQSSYFTSSQPVTIGHNVWIGGNTVIMPGITIGDGVVVGAGSVVTKSLPNGVLAFGNPCRVIRTI